MFRTRGKLVHKSPWPWRILRCKPADFPPGLELSAGRAMRQTNIEFFLGSILADLDSERHHDGTIDDNYVHYEAHPNLKICTLITTSQHPLIA